MSADRTRELLAQHVDDPRGARHRMVLLDSGRLRCVDCCVVLMLSALGRSTSTSSSTRIPPRAHDAGRCLRHAGEWADACRACRSEQLADEHRERPAPIASPEAIAAARAEIAEALARRTATTRESA